MSLGRGRGNFPLANWTSVAKGCGHGVINGCDISQAPPVHQEPVDRKLAIVTPSDKVQTYEGNIAPSTSRKDLANWSWVRPSNTTARLTNKNNNRMEQRWQRPDDNTDDRTLDKTGDHADPNSTEGNAVLSDEEGPGLEDLK